MNQQLAYLFARLALGLSMFGHGFVRVPKLEAFRAGMAEQFSGSMLPVGLVSGFGLVLPWLELLAGILLLGGLFTRAALILTASILLSLIFGSSAIENWNAISVQLVHMFFVVILLYAIALNRFSIDSILKK